MLIIELNNYNVDKKKEAFTKFKNDKIVILKLKYFSLFLFLYISKIKKNIYYIL